jgi:hypothetical protein
VDAGVLTLTTPSPILDPTDAAGAEFSTGPGLARFQPLPGIDLMATGPRPKHNGQAQAASASVYGRLLFSALELR